MANKNETREQEIKRKSVPYNEMDPETKAEFEANAHAGDVWNEESLLAPMNAEEEAEFNELHKELFPDSESGEE
jgi:hypothetical protein